MLLCLINSLNLFLVFLWNQSLFNPIRTRLLTTLTKNSPERVKFVTGKHESNRDLSSIRTTSGLSTNEVLSAPSSPSQFNEQSRSVYENTHIGRNPLLRGSKCNFLF